jgi:hypothetical protein
MIQIDTLINVLLVLLIIGSMLYIIKLWMEVVPYFVGQSQEEEPELAQHSMKVPPGAIDEAEAGLSAASSAIPATSYEATSDSWVHWQFKTTLSSTLAETISRLDGFQPASMTWAVISVYQIRSDAEGHEFQLSIQLKSKRAPLDWHLQLATWMDAVLAQEPNLARSGMTIHFSAADREALSSFPGVI